MDNYKGIIIDPGHGGLDVGFNEGVVSEKDFNLNLASYIYDRLKRLGFLVYLVRNNDDTISNYKRYEIINRIRNDIGKSLVISIHVDDEIADKTSIIRSIKSDVNANKRLYMELNKIYPIKTKTLVNDSNKDYYMIQRIPNGEDVIVIEYGNKEVMSSSLDIKKLGEEIVDIIVSYLSNQISTSFGLKRYVVEKGDYLYKLANRFKVSIEDIKKVNSMKTDSLDIGQVLMIPILKENIYIVKKGDSLYSIAKKFNTTIDKIKDINNLISNKLLVNQRLLIPD